jgi:hypothetical protein
MISKFKILVLAFTICLNGCKEEQHQKQIPQQVKKVITPHDIEIMTFYEAKTYHKDSDYKYQYRTGVSGHYEYNYRVIGYNQNLNEVSGNVNIEGKYGAGIITNKEGDRINIQVEWIHSNVLKAIDREGNIYELKAQ